MGKNIDVIIYRSSVTTGWSVNFSLNLSSNKTTINRVMGAIFIEDINLCKCEDEKKIT